MIFSRKDVAATALTALVLVTFVATHEGWNVWLVGGSHRWAAGVISVLGVLPGFVETPGFPQRTRLPRVLHPLIASPELVARRILDAVDHDRREIVVPRWYRPAAWAQALVPGLLATARARTSRRPPHSP